jgi:hypothetical protein
MAGEDRKTNRLKRKRRVCKIYSRLYRYWFVIQVLIPSKGLRGFLIIVFFVIPDHSGFWRIYIYLHALAHGSSIVTHWNFSSTGIIVTVTQPYCYLLEHGCILLKSFRPNRISSFTEPSEVSGNSIPSSLIRSVLFVSHDKNRLKVRIPKNSLN